MEFQLPADRNTTPLTTVLPLLLVQPLSNMWSLVSIFFFLINEIPLHYQMTMKLSCSVWKMLAFVSFMGHAGKFVSITIKLYHVAKVWCNWKKWHHAVLRNLKTHVVQLQCITMKQTASFDTLGSYDIIDMACSHWALAYFYYNIQSANWQLNLH